MPMDIHSIIDIMQELKSDNMLIESMIYAGGGSSESQRWYEPKVSGTVNEDTITLNQLYKHQRPDRNERIHDYGTMIWDNPYEIQSIGPRKLDLFLCGQYDVEFIEDLFDKMDPEQHEIVDRYVSDPDLSNQIIVMDNGYIVDGNHRAIAAALSNRSIRYIDINDDEELSETREGALDWLKRYLSNWPEYVLRDWLYRGLTAKEHNPPEHPKDVIDRILASEGMSAQTQWKLIPDFEFKLKKLHPDTQRRINIRAGGSANPMNVPKDAERHTTQAALAQQQGGVRKEPVIGKMTPQGFELIEGWHRTIQHFKQFPDGYRGPAWIAMNANNESISEASPDTLEGSFTPDLVTSKTWLCKLLAKGLKGKNAGTIYILGSWYGNMVVFLQQAGIKFNKIVLVEPDEEALLRSRELLKTVNDDGKLVLLSVKAEDVVYEKPGIIINTSCNETGPVFLTKLPDGMLVVLQSRNNVDDTLIDIDSLDEFLEYFPVRKIYYRGEKHLEDPETAYDRFMVIGRSGKKLDEYADEEFHTGGALGLPYPDTYEQENDKFQSHGQRRIRVNF